MTNTIFGFLSLIGCDKMHDWITCFSVCLNPNVHTLIKFNAKVLDIYMGLKPVRQNNFTLIDTLGFTGKIKCRLFLNTATEHCTNARLFLEIFDTAKVEVYAHNDKGFARLGFSEYFFTLLIEFSYIYCTMLFDKLMDALYSKLNYNWCIRPKGEHWVSPKNA